MSYLRQKKSNIFLTMLGSLSLPSIRNIYKELVGLETIPQDKNNKEAIQKLLEHCGAPHDQITELLFESEVEKPFRHIFLTRWTGKFNRIVDSREGIKQLQIQVGPIAGISNLVCDFVKVEQERIVFTFSHDASSTHWYWQDGGHFPESITVRHPIVVHFHQNGSLLITYPGFTFERGKEQNLEYYDLVSLILTSIQEITSIDYKPYAIKKVVEVLLKKQSARVNFIRIKSGNDEGAVDLQSKSNDLSIENLLPSLMVPYLPKGITEEQVKTALINAINDCDLRYSNLYWKEEEIATKLSYYELGMEFLVTWSRQDPSFNLVTPILEFLIFLSMKFESDNTNVLNFFIEKKNSRVFTKGEIASSISVNSKELDKELVGLVSQRVLETRYRLRTNKSVLDYENKWTNNLLDLRKQYELDDHSHFDGTLPENIEVGFIFPDVQKEVLLES